MYTEADISHKLQQRIPAMPETLLVLGSGWNKVIDHLKIEAEYTYQELFDVQATVPGHSGKLVVASYEGQRLVIMRGRFHMYEGFSAREVTTPIRVLGSLGVKKMIVTAAAGGLNEKYRVGDLVVISDVLTLFLALDNPLLGPQFLDMSNAFDASWKKRALQVASQLGATIHEGVYAYYHGPNFETPTDKRAFKMLGADIVGMSTVPEVLAARWEKMSVLGLALVTNLAFVKHDHLEVLAEAEKASEKMSQLLLGCISDRKNSL